MPSVLLDSRFWREQFLVPKEAVAEIHSYLTRHGVASSKEIAEIAVRSVIEGQSKTRGFRVYSPEHSYERGEVIFFHSERGPRFADVLFVEWSRDQSGQFSYRKMMVRFKGDTETHTYVTECPNFPTRFSGQLVIAGGEAFTPGAIAMKFHDSIAFALEETLLEDGRFLLFSGMWMLEQHFVELDDTLLSQVAHLLRKHGKLTSTEIARQLFRKDPLDRLLKTTSLSVAVGLASDKAKRFVCVGGGSELTWTLSPPPKEVAITMTGAYIDEGYLPVTEGLSKLLFYYSSEQDSVVTFTAYGDYKVRGVLDQDIGRIGGQEIRQWILENDLRPGNRIYAKSPDSYSSDIRLYTLLEISSRTPEDSEVREPQTRSRKYLRHLIYAVLLQRNQYMHYREIADSIAQGGTSVQASSVAAILSSNSHLFVRREPSKGLWGLKVWASSELEPDVSPTSLLLAIDEEAWVKRILEDEGRPLSGREIVNNLADVFQIRGDRIRELSFINANVGHLRLLSDGRWALSSWIQEWSNRIAEIERALAMANQVRKQVATLEGKVERAREKRANIQSKSANLKKRLRGDDEQRKEIGRCVERCQRQIEGYEHFIASSEEQLHDSARLSAMLRRSSVLLIGLLVLLTVTVLTVRSAAVTAIGVGIGLLLLAVRRYTARIGIEHDRVLQKREGLRVSLGAAQERLVDHSNQKGAKRRLREEVACEIDGLAVEETSTAAELDQLCQELGSLKREVSLCSEPDLLRERSELGELVELANR